MNCGPRRELIGIHLNSELWALLIRLLHDRVLCHKETRLIFRKRCPATLAKILAVHKVDLSLLRKVDPWGCLTSFFPLSWQTHLIHSIHAVAEILKRASLVGLTLLLEAQLMILIIFIALTDLLFRHVLGFVWQVVRVSVLRCNLFD